MASSGPRTSVRNTQIKGINNLVGIYKIQNLENGKCYIGQSVDIHRRWNDHKSSAFNMNAECYAQHLYRSMRKYGIDKFDFSVLEECNRDELLLQLSNLPFVQVASQYGVTDNAVRKWCKQYGLSTKASDYNVARPDNLPHLTRMVQMYTLDDKPIKTFASSADAAKEFNGKAKSIREVCQGRRKSVYGYHWRYLT